MEILKVPLERHRGGGGCFHGDLPLNPLRDKASSPFCLQTLFHLSSPPVVSEGWRTPAAVSARTVKELIWQRRPRHVPGFKSGIPLAINRRLRHFDHAEPWFSELVQNWSGRAWHMLALQIKLSYLLLS